MRLVKREGFCFRKYICTELEVINVYIWVIGLLDIKYKKLSCHFLIKQEAPSSLYSCALVTNFYGIFSVKIQKIFQEHPSSANTVPDKCKSQCLSMLIMSGIFHMSLHLLQNVLKNLNDWPQVLQHK